MTQPFEFETRKETKLMKLQHHIITQILLKLLKYIYTIKLFNLKLNTWVGSSTMVSCTNLRVFFNAIGTPQ